MATKKTATATNMDPVQQDVLDAVMYEFLELAQWKPLDEEELERHHSVIDEQIVAYEQRIKQLELKKSQVANREKNAQEMAQKMILLLGPAASSAKKHVVESMCIRFDVPKPKVKRRRRLNIAEEMLSTVRDVLDYEGMTFGDIKQALPAGSQIDADMLRKILMALADSKEIGSEGERRSKRYFLIAEEEGEEEGADDDSEVIDE